MAAHPTDKKKHAVTDEGKRMGRGARQALGAALVVR